MEIFCTYSDKNYLPQLISLINSFVEHENDFLFYVLALDQETEYVLKVLNYSQLIIINHSKFMIDNPNQKITFNNRPLINYYYTCTPVLIKYIFLLNKDTHRVTYIDADIYLFSNLKEYFNEINSYSISLIDHHTNKTENDPKYHGRFNVSIITFKNDFNGLSCLNWWEQKTFESTDFNKNVWGDQKYLDDFPKNFKNVYVVKNLGISCAPWNINKFSISVNNKGLIFINNNQIISYHFARLIMINKYFFIPSRRSNIDKKVLSLIYSPYIFSLKESYLLIKTYLPKYKIGYTKHNFRGLLLSLLGGRTFLLFKKKLLRIGFNIKLFYDE